MVVGVACFRDLEMSSGARVRTSKVGPDELLFSTLLFPEPGGPTSNKFPAKFRLSGSFIPGGTYKCITKSGITTNRNRRKRTNEAVAAVSQNEESAWIGGAAVGALPIETVSSCTWLPGTASSRSVATSL